MLTASQLANPELLELVPYEPGKPIEDVARELGLEPSQIIKLASNENPLGPSPVALEAIRAVLPKLHLYPDGGGFHLRNGLAEHFGVTREQVVLGNGSNEIIELLYHTFTRPGAHEVVTARNAFVVYKLMAQLFGVRCVEVPDVEFQHDLPAMRAAITPQTRLVFIANPNNPTGTRIPNQDLEKFLDQLPPHVVAVLDEAYYEFLENPPDTLRYVKQGAKVVLMRTFSKIQGLAGLRIGYGLASPEIANLLQRARQPFNTNTLAQIAALAGLKDVAHQQRTRQITDAGRAVLQQAFTRLNRRFVPSYANFVLVHVSDANQVFNFLLKQGIIVRSMVSYRLPEWIRVSIGTPEENARFLQALPEALASVGSVGKKQDT
jgi:histidinol-phosphate aminotransferase